MAPQPIEFSTVEACGESCDFFVSLVDCMTIMASIDKGLFRLEPEAVEPMASSTFSKCINIFLSFMLLIAFCTVGCINRLVWICLDPIENSTGLALIKSVNRLLIVLLMITFTTICNNRHLQ